MEQFCFSRTLGASRNEKERVSDNFSSGGFGNGVVGGKMDQKMVELVAENREALRNYEIGEKYEAGIKLTGSEIKSIRLKRVSLRSSFVKIVGGEPFVLNLKIHKYPYSSERDYDPKRTRKLLLKKNQIQRLVGKDSQKGFAIVPLQLYLKNNLAKLEIGVGKAKSKWDKRQILKEETVTREVEQEIKEHSRGDV